MIFLAWLCLVCIAIFLKLWDHYNKHIRFEEVIRLKEETLDEMLQRLSMECMEETKRLNGAAESGTEQFEEMVEKYQRNTFDDDER